MEYTYYLRNRTSNEEINLGQSAELKPEVAKEHGIDPQSWWENWIFGARAVEQETGAPCKAEPLTTA
jgi:hypothetical protein